MNDPTHVLSDEDFAEQLAEIFAELLAKQQRLDPELEAATLTGLEELYEE